MNPSVFTKATPSITRITLFNVSERRGWLAVSLEGLERWGGKHGLGEAGLGGITALILGFALVSLFGGVVIIICWIEAQDRPYTAQDILDKRRKR